jgi:hypothetical protein
MSEFEEQAWKTILREATIEEEASVRSQCDTNEPKALLYTEMQRDYAAISEHLEVLALTHAKSRSPEIPDERLAVLMAGVPPVKHAGSKTQWGGIAGFVALLAAGGFKIAPHLLDNVATGIVKGTAGTSRFVGETAEHGLVRMSGEGAGSKYLAELEDTLARYKSRREAVLASFDRRLAAAMASVALAGTVAASNASAEHVMGGDFHVEYTMVAQGARVTKVAVGGPADIAGLKPDDIILQVDNDSLFDLSAALAKLVFRGPPGSHAHVRFTRENQEFIVPVIRRLSAETENGELGTSWPN